MATPHPQKELADALIGDEEQSGKKEKGRNRKQILNPASLDHLVASYDPYGSYCEPILNPPPHK